MEALPFVITTIVTTIIGVQVSNLTSTPPTISPKTSRLILLVLERDSGNQKNFDTKRQKLENKKITRALP